MDLKTLEKANGLAEEIGELEFALGNFRRNGLDERRRPGTLASDPEKSFLTL